MVSLAIQFNSLKKVQKERKPPLNLNFKTAVPVMFVNSYLKLPLFQFL
jgi:hypothetical protein